MPVPNDPLLDSEYDVTVVGSGAAGGMAAYVLANEGVKVLMVEAGRDYEPTLETPMFNLPSEAPLFAASTPDKEQGFYDATVGGGRNIPGEPYTVAEGSRFSWWRARMLGGRTNHWGRVSLRFGPYDFKGYSRDGLGMDWPISYEDIAPYYDKVEGLIGVFGEAEGIENSPDSPAGLLHKPPKPRAHELWLKLALGRTMNVPVVPAHSAILTRQHGNRPACFYATDCLRGCSIAANFQSTTVLIPPARDTGNLTIRTDAPVYEVTIDANGEANGVKFIDAETGARHRVKARAVMLGASTAESARILLNSKSNLFPDGLANSSGQVGRNMTDTVKVGMIAQVPALEGLTPYNDEGVSLIHSYAPWWGYDAQRAGQLDFMRGCHLEFWGGRLQPGVGDGAMLAGLSGKIGSGLHDDIRRLYGSTVYISVNGEMIPNDGSYCELDPEVKDRWGLPVLRFNWRHDAHDYATASYQKQFLIDAFGAMNATILSDTSSPIEQTIRAGGSVVHEAGACRMGASAGDSVLNANGEAWDVPGLYVVDAGAFTSNPDKNPTLTILALAWRAADHLVDAMKRGER
ncbi:MAG: GMC family oxidoreductase [Henriciella sp.]|nr:GMC family oxidoreductase [Henriciella sp.]